METTRTDQNHGTGPAEPAAADPQLVEMLRAALAALAAEQKGANGAPAEAKKEEKKEDKPKKPEEQMPLFWKLCSAALVSVTALIVVTLYNQLSATASQMRSDAGQLRSDIGQLQNDLIRRDDYNQKVEQMINSIKEVQAGNKTAMDTWRDRLGEQKTTVSELRVQIKEAERDLQRLREELALLEQRDVKTPPTPDKTKGH
jgi:hypothetical protein